MLKLLLLVLSTCSLNATNCDDKTKKEAITLFNLTKPYTISVGVPVIISPEKAYTSYLFPDNIAYRIERAKAAIAHLNSVKLLKEENKVFYNLGTQQDNIIIISDPDAAILDIYVLPVMDNKRPVSDKKTRLRISNTFPELITLSDGQQLIIWQDNLGNVSIFQYGGRQLILPSREDLEHTCKQELSDPKEIISTDKNGELSFSLEYQLGNSGTFTINQKNELTVQVKDRGISITKDPDGNYEILFPDNTTIPLPRPQVPEGFVIKRIKRGVAYQIPGVITFKLYFDSRVHVGEFVDGEETDTIIFPFMSVKFQAGNSTFFVTNTKRQVVINWVSDKGDKQIVLNKPKNSKHIIVPIIEKSRKL